MIRVITYSATTKTLTVVHKETPVIHIIGVESQTQQAALIIAGIERHYAGSSVEERLLAPDAIGIDDINLPRLIRHKQPPRTIACVRQIHRMYHTFRDLPQSNCEVG